MLERLELHGLGIIDCVEMEFDPGFSVLTGETGAGKSLLVESLKLISGARASVDLIRSGEKKLLVEAWFSLSGENQVSEALEALGIDSSAGVVIRREILASGRSRSWINDSAVTAAALQGVSTELLAIHGQHEQFGLADPGIQRQLVDEYGGLVPLRRELHQVFEAYFQASAAVRDLELARSSRRDRLDVISFQLAEIEGSAPQSGEDLRLRESRQRLSHAGRLRELSTALLENLGDRDASVVEELARAEKMVAEMGDLGLEVRELSEGLESARVATEEALLGIRPLAESMHEDPRELDRVEERLHQLDGLMLKYGATLDSVLEHRQGLLTERAALLEVGDRLEEARRRSAECLGIFDQAAIRLQKAREKAGRKLCAALVEVLANLGMAGTRMEFKWEARPEAASPLQRLGQGVAFDVEGVEEAELLLAANPGEELRPMRKIASGGELSRLHLAIRTALRRAGPSGELSLLFDEVDTGIGGQVAAFLADLLADLAERDQVLVVTHLAQVAAKAENHFKVEKRLGEGRSRTLVRKLSPEERVREIARMLAGEELSDSAVAHARELLRR